MRTMRPIRYTEGFVLSRSAVSMFTCIRQANQPKAPDVWDWDTTQLYATVLIESGQATVPIPSDVWSFRYVVVLCIHTHLLLTECEPLVDRLCRFYSASPPSVSVYGDQDSLPHGTVGVAVKSIALKQMNWYRLMHWLGRPKYCPFLSCNKSLRTKVSNM